MVEQNGEVTLSSIVSNAILDSKAAPSGDCKFAFTNENSCEPHQGGVNSTANGHDYSTIGKTKSYTQREQELLRVIGQFLNEIGLSETSRCLTRESQCSLEHPAATRLRRHILMGNWKMAECCLDELKDTLQSLQSSHCMHKIRFWLYEQKYLELLDDGRVVDAVKCLRKDLVKIPGKQNCCHYLASLAMRPTKEDLRKAASWSGKGEQSRLELMDKLNGVFPPHVMLPRDRLRKLIDQSLQYQISNCIYHVVSSSSSSNQLSSSCRLTHQHRSSSSSNSLCASSKQNSSEMNNSSSSSHQQQQHQQHFNSPNHTALSLLTDHKCSKHQFPCRMKQTIMDLEEYLFCKFNHKGDVLAAGGNSGQIQLYRVTVQHRLKPFDVKLDHESPVGFFAWSPDDKYLVSCGARITTSAIVWNIATLDKLVRISNAADDSLTTACWLPDCTHFAVAGIHGHFYLCNLDGNIEIPWEGIRVIALVALSRENTVLAADNHNRVRSYSTDKKDATILQTDKPIMSMELTKCDQFLLCTMEKGGLQLYHLESGTLLLRLAGLKQEKDFIFSSMGGSPDETFIASGSEDKCVYIWHRDKSLPIAVLSGHTKQVNSVDWNPAIHSMLVSVSDDCTIKVWGPAPSQTSSSKRENEKAASDGANENNSASGSGGGGGGTNPFSNNHHFFQDYLPSDDDNYDGEDDDDDDDEMMIEIGSGGSGGGVSNSAFVWAASSDPPRTTDSYSPSANTERPRVGSVHDAILNSVRNGSVLLESSASRERLIEALSSTSPGAAAFEERPLALGHVVALRAGSAATASSATQENYGPSSVVSVSSVSTTSVVPFNTALRFQQPQQQNASASSVEVPRTASANAPLTFSATASTRDHIHYSSTTPSSRSQFHHSSLGWL